MGMKYNPFTGKFNMVPKRVVKESKKANEPATPLPKPVRAENPHVILPEPLKPVAQPSKKIPIIPQTSGNKKTQPVRIPLRSPTGPIPTIPYAKPKIPGSSPLDKYKPYASIHPHSFSHHGIASHNPSDSSGSSTSSINSSKDNKDSDSENANNTPNKTASSSNINRKAASDETPSSISSSSSASAGSGSTNSTNSTSTTGNSGESGNISGNSGMEGNSGKSGHSSSSSGIIPPMNTGNQTHSSSSSEENPKSSISADNEPHWWTPASSSTPYQSSGPGQMINVCSITPPIGRMENNGNPYPTPTGQTTEGVKKLRSKQVVSIQLIPNWSIPLIGGNQNGTGNNGPFSLYQYNVSTSPSSWIIKDPYNLNLISFWSQTIVFDLPPAEEISSWSIAYTYGKPYRKKNGLNSWAIQAIGSSEPGWPYYEFELYPPMSATPQGFSGIYWGWPQHWTNMPIGFPGITQKHIVSDNPPLRANTYEKGTKFNFDTLWYMQTKGNQLPTMRLLAVPADEIESEDPAELMEGSVLKSSLPQGWGWNLKNRKINPGQFYITIYLQKK